MKVLIVVALFASQLAWSATSPEETARQYADAIAKHDWHAAVGLMNPGDVSLVRSAMTRQLEGSGEEARRELFGNLSALEISKLSDAEFCEIAFAGSSAALQQQGLEFEALEQSRILGMVPDGESMMYVVIKHRGSVEGRIIESVDLWPVVRIEREWFMGIPKLFEAALWADR